MRPETSLDSVTNSGVVLLFNSSICDFNSFGAFIFY